jgi:hypothetical protein
MLIGFESLSLIFQILTINSIPTRARSFIFACGIVCLKTSLVVAETTRRPLCSSCIAHLRSYSAQTPRAVCMLPRRRGDRIPLPLVFTYYNNSSEAADNSNMNGVEESPGPLATLAYTGMWLDKCKLQMGAQIISDIHS